MATNRKIKHHKELYVKAADDGDWEKVIEYVNWLIENDPEGDLELYFAGKGDALFSLKKFSSALEALNQQN